jgi:hypothetical protein
MNMIVSVGCAMLDVVASWSPGLLQSWAAWGSWSVRGYKHDKKLRTQISQICNSNTKPRNIDEITSFYLTSK